MRRLLIGLVFLTFVVIAVVFVTSRGDDEPKGETERGAPGFPLRGSLAGDTEAIDTAVAEWREETAEDAKEAEEDDDDDDDAETRDDTRAAQTPATTSPCSGSVAWTSARRSRSSRAREGCWPC